MSKDSFGLENHFNRVRNFYLTDVTRFRMCYHYRPIEKHRWLNTEINERKCTLCFSNDIGGEYHYMFDVLSAFVLVTRFRPMAVFVVIHAQEVELNIARIHTICNSKLQFRT